MGLSVDQLMDMPENFTVSELIDAGIDVDELLYSNSVNLVDILETGVDLDRFYRADVPLSEFEGSDVSLQDLRNSGYTVADFIEAGYSYNSILDAGFLKNEFDQSFLSVSDLLEGGADLSKIYNAGFNLSEFVEDEVPLVDALLLDVSNKELFLAGYPLEELEGFNIDLEMLAQEGVTLKQFIDNRVSIDKLVRQGYNVNELLQNGAEINGAEGIGIDQDNYNFKWVGIGEQIWMAENLRVTNYNDGTPIHNETSTTDWRNETIGAYCWYDNDISYKDPYGALYNHYVALDDKTCPTGWKVPSGDGWTQLYQYLQDIGHTDKEYVVLKSTTGWKDDYNGTDLYGFNALPAGIRSLGTFSVMFGTAEFWSSTEESNSTKGVYMHYGSDAWDFLLLRPLSDGASIRCIKK